MEKNEWAYVGLLCYLASTNRLLQLQAFTFDECCNGSTSIFFRVLPHDTKEMPVSDHIGACKPGYISSGPRLAHCYGRQNVKLEQALKKPHVQASGGSLLPSLFA